MGDCLARNLQGPGRPLQTPFIKRLGNYAGPERGETLPAFFSFFSSLFSLRDLEGFFFPSFFVSLAFDMILPPQFIFHQQGNKSWFSPADGSYYRISPLVVNPLDLLPFAVQDGQLIVQRPVVIDVPDKEEAPGE